MVNLVATGLAIGIVGTVAMDLWAWVLNRLFGQPMPNWAMPGRWLAHVFRGRLFHTAIADAAPVRRELAIGWLFHYGVGAIYGAIFALVLGQGWLDHPTFWPVWALAIITIGAGWFLLQPGMGLGIAANKTPNPWKVRVMGLLAHSVFGFGIWLAALVLG